MMASAWLTAVLDQFFDQKRRGNRQVGAAEIECTVAAEQQQDRRRFDATAGIGFAPYPWMQPGRPRLEWLQALPLCAWASQNCTLKD